MKNVLVLVFSILILGCSNQKSPQPAETKVAVKPLPVGISIKAPAIEDPKKNQNENSLLTEAYIPILMFHHIEPVASDHPDQIFYGLSFHPDKLEQFLQYFEQRDIKTLTFDDLTKIFNGQMQKPDKAVMLTFDDGYTNNFNLARPLLEKYNMVGNFALISQNVPGGGFYMNEQQAQKLAETQHICSHTITHPNLTSLSDQALKNELIESQKYLQNLTGQNVKCLVYPAGKNNARVRRVVAKHYDWARTTSPGKTVYANKKLQLPTVRIFPTTGVASLKTWFE